MEESDLENKCENLMNNVVETRKHFGKLYDEYGKKISTVENLLMNSQIKMIANMNLKKPTIPPIEDRSDMDQFCESLIQRSKRIEELKKKIENTKKVVFQLQNDKMGKRVRNSLSTDKQHNDYETDRQDTNI